jgi:hypothetical protein
MAIVEIGIKWLFDSLGCSIQGDAEFFISKSFQDKFNANIYLGPTPKHQALEMIKLDKYIVPGRGGKFFNLTPYEIPSTFFEICISKPIEFQCDDIQFAKLNPETQNTIKAQAESIRIELERVMTAIVGVAALLFHRQLILKPLSEAGFIKIADEYTYDFRGVGMENLSRVEFVSGAQEILDSIAVGVNSCDNEEIAKIAKLLSWLSKAWRETDPISKFLFYFIPIEAILDNTDIDDQEKKNAVDRAIQIVSECEQSDKDDIIKALSGIKTRYSPSLNSRFEEFARVAQIPGWEKDAKAFKKFNKIRNDLLHSGKADVRLFVEIDGITRSLEDIAERYVAFKVMQNPNVYFSQWRPKRE